MPRGMTLLSALIVYYSYVMCVNSNIDIRLFLYTYTMGPIRSYRRGVLGCSFRLHGQFLGPQAVERVTDRVSTLFLYRYSLSFKFNRLLGDCKSDYITIKRETYLLLSVLLIFIGELIYILYRPLTLYMFKPFEQMSMLDNIRYLRASHLFPHIEEVPGWVVYSLPDGMWLLSYLFAMESIWYNEGKHIRLLFVWIMPTAIIIHEFCQLMRLAKGTWDINDFSFYIIAIIIYLLTKK